MLVLFADVTAVNVEPTIGNGGSTAALVRGDGDSLADEAFSRAALSFDGKSNVSDE